MERERASRVLPWLYVGNKRDALDPHLLQELRVSHVLSLTDLPPPIKGLQYRQLPAADTPHQNIKQYFDEAFLFIGK
jgi:dual specificity MAP kinase phosphatase